MSEPIRYAMSWATDEDEFVYVSPKEQPNGNWVKWEDYARLKAEVERLTKSGDGLYKSMLEIGCNEMADNFQYDAWFGSMKDWNAAKEGKQP
jgi:hypothetical protein